MKSCIAFQAELLFTAVSFTNLCINCGVFPQASRAIIAWLNISGTGRNAYHITILLCYFIYTFSIFIV
jgi:hypothetical protein